MTDPTINEAWSTEPQNAQPLMLSEAGPADADKWALRLISMSSLRDFRDGDEWGKWCRSVAGAGLMKDDKKLAWLEREMTGTPNDQADRS